MHDWQTSHRQEFIPGWHLAHVKHRICPFHDALQYLSLSNCGPCWFKHVACKNSILCLGQRISRCYPMSHVSQFSKYPLALGTTLKSGSVRTYRIEGVLADRKKAPLMCILCEVRLSWASWGLLQTARMRRKNEKKTWFGASLTTSWACRNRCQLVQTQPRGQLRGRRSSTAGLAKLVDTWNVVFSGWRAAKVH
jgi:hypothetical protein